MAASSARPVLFAKGISKRYPGTLALDRVDFAVYPGQVNVLIGENGAGKSTLMKILSGVETPSEGRLEMEGREIRLASTRDARRHGIGIIHQELSLFPNLSVAENLFLAREMTTKWGSVRHSVQEEAAGRLMTRLEQAIAPKSLVADLRIGQQQLVEIARALAEDVRVLIMDEPTSALSTRETESLMRIMRELTAQGVAIVYISHKLDECLLLGDRFTVLRDGRRVAEGVRDGVDLGWIVRAMSGRGDEAAYVRGQRRSGPPLLDVRDLTLPRLQGDGYLLDHVSLSVRSGEVVGLYGLMGAGKTELLESLFGVHPEAMGAIRLVDRLIDGLRIDQRMEAGLALIPEDRQRQGIVQKMTVSENVTLASLRKLVRGPGLSRKQEERAVRESTDSLGVKMADPHQTVSTLSGGNQQKVVVAKALLTSPRLLMMDEPTRGIDVGAKLDMLRIMDDLAGRGLGVLFASSEVKEVVAAADRVLVLARGRISGEFSGPDITEQALVAASLTSPAPADQTSA